MSFATDFTLFRTEDRFSIAPPILLSPIFHSQMLLNTVTHKAREVRAKYRSNIIEEPRFNGASIEAIRTHFETRVDAQGIYQSTWNRFRMCIIIDEESLQTLQGTSAEQVEQEGPHDVDHELRCMKVLQAWPNVDQYDTFPGWMKCWTRALWDLWIMMIDGGEMSMLYDSIDDFPFEG
ncbi:uncharacterized protein N7484_000456, partial [Penicillium longicatenatum]|uniref:uncharacterized protein n=1 Tax=Penicillium longicatenatum TaxID=1561947 RepID=UPI002547D85B